MLIKGNSEQDFINECKKEIELLDLTRRLFEHDFLIWELPTVQIRSDKQDGIILKRILQIHGVIEDRSMLDQFSANPNTEILQHLIQNSQLDEYKDLAQELID